MDDTPIVLLGEEAVPLGGGVWWVGSHGTHDSFPSHAYFIDNGFESVLIDPGSPLTIRDTLRKIDDISFVNSIKYLVCHNPDADIAAALPMLSRELTRDDIVVVTEWRAKALLKHYGHRFNYYLVDEHDWTLPLSPGRDLEFQLTPYLHFPGAMVSYDTGSRILFSSDLFGGFVPDTTVLISHDARYTVESMSPFHQHYMPSNELLATSLMRMQNRWGEGLQFIAPQHGHIIPQENIKEVFSAVQHLECGVYTLGDADKDFKHLLRISAARSQLMDSLMSVTTPHDLVMALEAVLITAREKSEIAVLIDDSGSGWLSWRKGSAEPTPAPSLESWTMIILPGSPNAAVALKSKDNMVHPNLTKMFTDASTPLRVAVDRCVENMREQEKARILHRQAYTDQLTSLGNRRHMESRIPTGDYGVLALDLDHFKNVNDTHGHAMGDTVLREVAGVMARAIRDTDTAYRIGGEEFVIIARNIPSDAAGRLAERVRKGIEKLEFTDELYKGGITVSIGVACAVDASSEDYPRILEAADTALYEAKRKGRNRVINAGVIPLPPREVNQDSLR